jgi:hypothetical protein
LFYISKPSTNFIDEEDEIQDNTILKTYGINYVRFLSISNLNEFPLSLISKIKIEKIFLVITPKELKKTLKSLCSYSKDQPFSEITLQMSENHEIGEIQATGSFLKELLSQHQCKLTNLGLINFNFIHSCNWLALLLHKLKELEILNIKHTKFTHAIQFLQ